MIYKNYLKYFNFINKNLKINDFKLIIFNKLFKIKISIFIN